MKRFIKSNLKVVFAFIIGGIIFSGTTLVLAAIGADQVTYTNNGQSTVQGALDVLYTKANNALSIDANTFKTSSETSIPIIASSKGVCIKRAQSNKIECFSINNYSVERHHIQQVFNDVNCYEDNTFKQCTSQSDPYEFCQVASTGDVSCYTNGTGKGCSVGSNGTVYCS